MKLHAHKFLANETDDPLHYAFDRKSAVHPGVKGHPIDPKTIQGIWKQAMSKQAEKEKRVAYFHIPFCETHCLFCGFYQNAYDPQEEDRYINSLIRELEMVADAPVIKTHPFHAIYLGGGTPTSLSATNLLRLLKAIDNALPLANDCEITVEGRIHHFSDEKLSACLEGGANRLSLGVQSFNTSVRRKMGRVHPEEEIIERLKYINSLDQAVVVIDLIYGLPYQHMDVWEKDVRQYIDLGIDGVDLYQLNIYKGGRLEQAEKEGLISPPAHIPMQADMFARGVDIMKQARYIRLSMSHWAKTTRERNIYNILARGGRVCVPFGSGAGGWLQGYFFYQDNNLEGYYQRVERGEKPIALCMKWPEYNDLLRAMVGEIDWKGTCNLRAMGEIYGLDLEHIFLPLLEQWERVGLIKMDNGWMDLTLAGEFWHVNLCQGLIDYFTKCSIP